MREPIGVKKYYPNGSSLLDNKLTQIFESERGPGALPAKLDTNDSIRAVIVPHAPYDLAGACMAWSYKAIAENQLEEPPLYIIVAQAQDGAGSGLTMETFVTPYNEVRVDQVFARSLLEKKHISLNDELHSKESVIEIQLPFLQFIHQRNREKIKILPLFVDETVELDQLAVDIKEILVEQNKQAVFIFASNLTNYGRQFGYVPYTEEIPENIQKLDKELIEKLQSFDKSGFDEVCKESLVPLSSYYVLSFFLQYFKEGNLLLEQYYLSGEVTESYTNTVSYASLVLK